VPETFDLQDRFDELARDVARAAGPGDATVPVRRARRRRGVAGAVAMAVAVTVGVAALQVVGDERDAGVVDSLGQSSGQERRERLLALLPPDSNQVNVVDVVGFTGQPGLDYVRPGDRPLFGYLIASFIKVQGGPFGGLLIPHLVTYAGNGSTNAYLVDRRPDEIVDRLLQAGWVTRGDIMVPGPRVSETAASLGNYVRITDEAGQALVVIAHDRGDLPDAGSSSEPGPLAARLADLGGAVGYSIDLNGSCAAEAVSLSSTTRGSVLLTPPEGVAPDAVGVDTLEVPDAFSSIDTVTPAGDAVRLEVTVPDAGGPLRYLRRLGLPGTEFC
jgi:hypothetical protein